MQVGDVHLPGNAQHRHNLDDKDKRFPVELKGILSSSPIKIVFKQIYSFISKQDVSAMLFMGDLTDIGGLGGYRSCANYIARSLQLGSGNVHSSLPVGIIPGNHDINRDLAKLPGLTRKFQPLTDALQAVGLPALPVSKPLWLRLQEGAAQAQIALLNSCWGCGAREFIPEEFRDDVEAAIDNAIKRGNAERATRAYYDRQFDTPAFNEDSIREFVQGANGIARTGLLIACAHHNLLPQRQPRLAPYTEVVNSGAVRGTLKELGRPILYLHGHIHEDPIEILHSPGGDPLVCISAPEASAGFNVLEIVFTRAGLPLSCHIHKWRFDQSGVFRSTGTEVVSLLGQRRRAYDKSLSRLYAHLLTEGESYWSDLLQASHGIFATDAEESLEESLEVLWADARIRIDNYDLPPENWIVGARL
ncbi:metallophosphoesterase family protein [Microvirga alba]|uniref:Metallophosphoesterase n=1 Tax=Microvirga alba TaxID=2791025 RepID=A0A931BNJ4_9HYPH|nr:metallophosphoesterase [Microvirga alba]MBF9234447.1 metallophosphoesterase [Microvirga alba]